jgi:hypothetical protein
MKKVFFVLLMVISFTFSNCGNKAVEKETGIEVEVPELVDVDEKPETAPGDVVDGDERLETPIVE